jgi:ABC-2 type transport system ATP-binding protein
MRIITGYMPASAGTVKVAGYDVFEQGLEVKKRIGYLPENPPLYYDMRVREYLTFVARIKGVNPKTINAEVDRVAERLSVLEVMDNLISNLSKGYKQRVGLAQALLNNPPVLIFDEPTNGLDPRQIIEVREIIKSLGSDHTVILSTHILPEVSMTCNRVAIINEGKLVKIDTPENLTKQLRGSESIILQVEGPMNEVELALSQHQSVTAVAVQPTGKENIATYRVETSIGSDIRKELASLVVNRGWGLLELKAESLSLEDIFLKLTTKEEEVN